MKFFESRRGHLYPISDIERIIPSSEPTDIGRPRYARVYLRGNTDTVEISEGTIEIIQRAGERLIPAQEGFTVIGFYHSDDPDKLDPWVDRTPVIAWRMGSYGPEPVTLDEMYNDELGIRHAILLPDGNVKSPAMQADYDSIDNWEEDMLKSVKEAMARKAANK